MEAAYSTAFADRRFASADEDAITTLAKSLGVKITYDDETAEALARFKLLAEIDSGQLPTVSAALLLKRGETCHFAAPAAHNQIRSTTKRINYSGPVASIRIMKGVRWRVGSIAIQRVTADVMTKLDEGQLYITRTRLLFDGAKKNVSLFWGEGDAVHGISGRSPDRTRIWP